ncbi:MAG: glycosyl transferase [Candidatus Competibacteraceae bacterium]|nr:glycosyl transferase [Candidatus Competibacteraceae bacterium]
MSVALFSYARPPEGQTISNGCYTAFLTTAGTGYSSWGELALTRWSADPTEDADGFFLYLRDLDSGVFWSMGQPALKAPTASGSRLGVEPIELARQDEGIEARLEICVPAQHDLELRRVTLRNLSDRPRRIELTSYAEIVLNAPSADAAHPAFSKIFIQTEWAAATRALLARRRPRVPDEPACWLVHALAGHDRASPAPQYETDRARFIGRGYTLAAPRALAVSDPLSGTVGNVLDPIASLRHTVALAAGSEARLTFLLGAAADRETALALAARYAETAAVEAAFQAVTADPRAPVPWQTYERPSAPLNEPEGWRDDSQATLSADEALQFWNGYGGFSADGREYVIRIQPDATGRLRLPPQPWTNVIANPHFGFLTSETGAGYTWSQNSRENRLTPWYNDPVLDPHGEALYLRDEDSGAAWSLQPGPIPQPVAYEVRHGFGYSRYRQISRDLEQEVHLFAPRQDPVKLTLIRLRNRSGRPRQLSLFAYSRLVLGVLPTDDTAKLTIAQDSVTGALLAENQNREFAGRLAFAASLQTGTPLYVTGDRASFLGQHGNPSRPAALLHAKTLDGRLGADLDPCFALQATIRLEPGAALEHVFLLGEADHREHAIYLIDRYRADGAALEALADVQTFWRDRLERVQIQTPTPAVDLMVNGWLAYQTLACRLWGRSAFYQSGGAFGFRDQLQDAAALLYHDPELIRQQLLLNAAHQFQEGDVLHWWHPPSDCGIRTRFSDDLLWLPWLASFYARATGDWSLFGEPARFLTARSLEPGEDEAFLRPEESGETANLYEHCCRALDRSLTQGAHGLPLMGTGDWNDGMNRVGREGRGESVWMGFFLYAILGDFIPVCGQHGDFNRARRYAAFRTHLATALNEHAWDGAWYRRAWYDDGAVLGSAASDECRIDALAQAWAVISKAAPWERAESALDAVERHLISERDGLIRLLAPPFENTAHDPGYIKGYVAGVRENGGQYTHAALWVVRALAELGRRDQAARLLEMLSPISRARTPEQVANYRVEPFVVAADIYGVAPHVGRGGWTWYTGSAGWMLRVMLESILGLELNEGRTLRLRPCIPDDWPGFQLHYRLPDDEALYEIEVRNPERNAKRVAAVQIDEREGLIEYGAACIPIVQDGARHEVVVTLAGALSPPR